MIPIIERYVAARTLANIALAWLALVAVFSLIRFAEELRDIGSGGYGVLAATRFLIHTTPAEALRLLTPAVLVGTANALGDLAAHNETIALAACGVSRVRILASVLGVVVAIAAAGLGLGDLAAAPLAQRAHVDRALALSGGRAVATSGGLWARDGDSFVNIRRAGSPRRLRGIYVYRFDRGRRLESYTYAKRALWRDGHWLLEDVVEGTVGPSGMVTHREGSRIWSTTLVPRQIALLELPIEDLSTSDLLAASAALGRRGESDRRHQAALWSRLASPLSAAALATLAVAFFARTGVRSRIGPRVVAAALAGVGFQLADGMVGRALLLSGAPPPLGAVALPAATLIAGLLWLGGLPKVGGRPKARRAPVL
jgi:lipopolysaccharide export system permease protein